MRFAVAVIPYVVPWRIPDISSGSRSYRLIRAKEKDKKKNEKKEELLFGGIGRCVFHMFFLFLMCNFPMVPRCLFSKFLFRKDGE